MSYLRDHDRPPESKSWQEIDVAKLDPDLVQAFERFHTLPSGPDKFEAQEKVNELAEADEIYPHLEPHELFVALLANYQARIADMSRDEGEVVDEKDKKEEK